VVGHDACFLLADRDHVAVVQLRAAPRLRPFTVTSSVSTSSRACAPLSARPASLRNWPNLIMSSEIPTSRMCIAPSSSSVHVRTHVRAVNEDCIDSKHGRNHPNAVRSTVPGM
jgi:hypothetical protein